MMTSFKLFTLLFTLQKARQEIGDAITLCGSGSGSSSSSSASSSTEKAEYVVSNLGRFSAVVGKGRLTC